MGLGKYFKVALLIALVYVFIFNPPIKSLPSLTWLLLPFVYGYLIYYSLTAKMIYLFKNEIIIILLLVLYTIIRDFDWSSGLLTKVFMFGNATLITDVIPFSFFIADVCYRKIKLPRNVSVDNRLIDIILWTCFIGALITIILLASPSLAFKMNNKILESSDYQQNNILRGFGFSSFLFYSYGIVQGVAAALLLLKMSRSNKYLLVYILVFVMLLISILVNARIGMVPVIVMTLYLIFIKGKIKIFLYGTSVVGVMLWVFLSSSFAEKYAKTIDWATSFFTQTFGFVSNNNSPRSTNTYSVLFDKMFILPDDFMGWIVGTGDDLFFKSYGNSDVGFIRQLYFGGILYLGLIILLIYIMSLRIYKLKKYGWFLVLFFFTVIFSNIKSNFISNQPGLRILVLMYMGFIYYSYKERTNKKLTQPGIDYLSR